MHRLLIAILFAIALSAPAADGPGSPADFTGDFVQALRERAPTYTVTATRELQVAMVNPKGREDTIFLYRAYDEYRLAPNDEARIIRKYSAGLISARDEVRKLNRARIIPVLKNRMWLEEVRAVAKAKGTPEAPGLVYDPFGEELIMVYAEDNPNSLRYVTPEQMSALGLKPENMRALAATNLKALLSKIDIRPSPLVTIVKAGGSFEASLVVLDEFWSSGKLKVDGDIVIAIPARDHLLITGSANAAGLAKLRELATRTRAESTWRLTETLFVYRNGRFEAFKD